MYTRYHMVFAHAQYDYRTCSAKIFHPAAGPIDTAIILSYSVFTIGIITGTVMNCLQSLVLFIATIGSSSDLIYYLVLLLLLLSGDVELNPGPITGKHTLNTTLIN